MMESSSSTAGTTKSARPAFSYLHRQLFKRRQFPVELHPSPKLQLAEPKHHTGSGACASVIRASACGPAPAAATSQLASDCTCYAS